MTRVAPPALIAGGGVAGLTLALALARRGLPSRIVERAARLEEAGAGVQLSPNASRILDALGLGEALDAVSTRPEAVSIHDAPTAARLKRIGLGAAAERRWGAPYRVVHRADLQAALLTEVQAEGRTEITLGADVLSARETDRGVTLEVASGAIEGGWLAGADGLRSVARAAVGLSTELGEARLNAWRTTLPASALPRAFAGPEVSVWLGPGAHLVAYPVRRGREANVVLIGSAGAAGPDGLARGWAATARDLVAATAAWTPWPLFDRPPDVRMRRGRIALLGDAAHPAYPSLAQGAAFAIEDAATLARLVAEGGADPLGAYEALRRARVARLQREARRQIGIDHLSGVAALARNTALRLAPESALIRGLDWIYGWRDAP